MPGRAELGALLAGLTLALPASAASVLCHVTYGGTTQTLSAQPSAAPYAEPATQIGTFFRFRIVVRDEPVELAGIKLYTYANHASGPALLHQASHAYPPVNLPAYGFSGLNYVYEPLRDGELQYWCEFQPGAAK